MPQITITPRGSATVAVTQSGAALTTYSDAAMTSAATLPAAISETTTYYVANVGPALVTAEDAAGNALAAVPIDLNAAAPCIVTVGPSAETAAQLLTVPRWDDLRLSLAKATVGSATPALAAFMSTLQAWSFSKTATNELFFDVQLPHSWVLGSEIRPHIHWSPGASTDTGDVVWQLEYSWANANAAFPTPTILTKVAQAGSGVANAHQLVSLGTIAGTGKRASSVLMCRLARLGGDAADTFDAVAFGLSVDFHIQVLGQGGLTEYAGAV